MLHPGERTVMRNQFNAHMRLAKGIDAYWLPSVGWTTFRAIERMKRSPNKLPEDALLVGRYTPGATSAAFIDDVEALLSEIGRAPLIAPPASAQMGAPCG